MDPIEKLLSELAPARAPGDLDQTMARIFDRADRRASVRRVARNTLVLAAMLVVGLAVGYRWGESNVVPSPPTEITYVVPAPTPQATGAFLDYSNRSESLLEGDIRLSVEVLPVSAPASAETENGV